MSACTFFGHGEEKGPDISVLQNAIEEWIRRGVDVFLVGHQGNFDRMVYRCLKQMQTQYPHIRISVVLASLSVEQSDLTDTVYPEIEGHPKFAI